MPIEPVRSSGGDSTLSVEPNGRIPQVYLTLSLKPEIHRADSTAVCNSSLGQYVRLPKGAVAISIAADQNSAN
jgi:hypothetical protein